ncbi:hypothetical protein LCGC14_0466360 [marine sediment metagenome]|uniref:Uncharacterized protein n=1 Tax=marine sediment metagenome TaxID=412755 RepID=A0A0F9V0C1_9ZZZZ
MVKGIKRLINIVYKNVTREISAHAKRGRIAGAMAGEGYNGGYRDALDDVILALNGNISQRHGWWIKHK